MLHKRLEGHQSIVWAVASLPNGSIVSGSADKTIRFYDENFNCVNTVATTYPVRGLWVVPEVGFLSCGSGESLQLWAFDGTLLHDLRGSRDTVFGISSLPSGEIVSCSEDGVTVWNGSEPTQTLPTPKTAWSVAALDNGDIVCGCQDRKIRVFTRDAARFMPDDLLAAYMEDVFAAASEAAEAAKPKRSVVNGTEYDEVIDVDLAEGQPTIPLGFNYNERPVDVAERFITEQNISAMYLDQITNFVTNTMAQRSLANGPSVAPYVDPFRDTEVPSQYGRNQSTPSRSAPAPAPAKKEAFPVVTPILVEIGSAAPVVTKFKQLKDQMNEADSATITDDAMASVLAIAKILTDNPFGAQGARFGKPEIQGFLQLLETVPSDKRFPLLDLARMAILYPEFAGQAGAATLELALRDLDASTGAAPFSQLMALRVFLNAFKWKITSPALEKLAEPVLEHLSSLISSTANANIPSLAISLLRNYATLLSTTKSEARLQILSIAQEGILLSAEASPEFVYLGLFATGTLLSRDAQLILVAQSMGIQEVVEVHAGSADANVKSASQSIISLFTNGIPK